MTDILRSLLRLVWEIIPIQIPWRNLIFVLILIIFLFWLFLKALPWLIIKGSILLLIITEFIFKFVLWIDYILLIKRRRRKNLQPLWISYLLGDLLSFLTRIIYLASNYSCKKFALILDKKWFPSSYFLIIISIIFLLTWHFEPIIRTWWYLFERWMISGKSKSMTALISPEKFVRDYYDHINNNQYRIAYNYLSQDLKKQKNNNYNDYLYWWITRVKKVNLRSIYIISESYRSATVEARLQYVMKKDKKISTPEDNIKLFLIWDSQNCKWLIANLKSYKVNEKTEKI
jgi:hypothetical protein